MPPLSEAGASIPPFFCIFGFVCFCDMSPDFPIVFAPDAPDGDAVAPLAFGVPIPVPPWPPPAPPPPPVPAPCALAALDKPKMNTDNSNPFMATRMMVPIVCKATSRDQSVQPPLRRFAQFPCRLPVDMSLLIRIIEESLGHASHSMDGDGDRRSQARRQPFHQAVWPAQSKSRTMLFRRAPLSALMR
jgi:hypothetical protein